MTQQITINELHNRIIELGMQQLRMTAYLKKLNADSPDFKKLCDSISANTKQSYELQKQLRTLAYLN